MGSTVSRRGTDEDGALRRDSRRTYRKAIDDYLESPEKYKENMPWYWIRSQTVPTVILRPDFSLENRPKKLRSMIITPMRRNTHILAL